MTGDERIREVAVPVATVWTGPDAPREVDEAAVRDLPDTAAWTGALDATTRLDLVGRTLTQVLLGDRVDVVSEQGSWAEVVVTGQACGKDPRGYPGWVRLAHLAEPVRQAHVAVATVTSPSTPCTDEDGTVAALSCGTVLPVSSTDDRDVEVLLPGGRAGRVPVGDVRIGDPGRVTVDDVLGAARRFHGLQYLWGGTSAWGLDCSGLVHLAYRSLGLAVPRDASDQAAAPEVERVPLDRVRPGDLYFFARPDRAVHHVGFASRPVGDDAVRWMLHAPERDGGGTITEEPLDEERLATLVAAGRVTLPR